jgi:hypothetical protein
MEGHHPAMRINLDVFPLAFLVSWRAWRESFDELLNGLRHAEKSNLFASLKESHRWQPTAL